MRKKITPFTFSIEPKYKQDMILQNGKASGVGTMPSFTFKEEDYQFAKELLNTPLSQLIQKSANKRENPTTEYNEIMQTFKKFNINSASNILDLKSNEKALRAIRMLVRFNFIGNNGIDGMENFISDVHKEYDKGLKNDKSMERSIKDLWSDKYGDCRPTNTWLHFLTTIYIDEKNLEDKYESRLGNLELYLDVKTKKEAKIDAGYKSDKKKPINRGKELGYYGSHCTSFLLNKKMVKRLSAIVFIMMVLI